MASTSDSTLYLYTSLTAGSSHIITATSRLETILKANKIPFRAVDCATDEKARMLWGRRSKGRKLPGLVKFGNVIGDIDQIEEWNEFGELTEQIEAADFAGVNPDAGRSPHPSATLPLDFKPPDSTSSGPPSRGSSQGRHISISEPTEQQKNAARAPERAGDPALNATLRQLGSAAAAKAAQRNTPTAVKTAKASTEEAEGSSDPQIPAKSLEERVLATRPPATLSKKPSELSESTPAAASSDEAPKSSNIDRSSQPLESAEKSNSEAT
ncbi:hypothetical protein DV735_g3333, partial [Chaetothyriales sp. CBS 134920]